MLQGQLRSFWTMLSALRVGHLHPVGRPGPTNTGIDQDDQESSLFKMVDTVQVSGRRSSGDGKKMCQSLRIFDQITDVNSTVQDEATLVDGLLTFMVDDLLIPEFGL